MLVAAARVQRATGVPVMVHTEGDREVVLARPEDPRDRRRGPDPDPHLPRQRGALVEGRRGDRGDDRPRLLRLDVLDRLRDEDEPDRRGPDRRRQADLRCRLRAERDDQQRHLLQVTPAHVRRLGLRPHPDEPRPVPGQGRLQRRRPRDAVRRQSAPPRRDRPLRPGWKRRTWNGPVATILARPTSTRTGARSSRPTRRTCSAPGVRVPVIPVSSVLRSHAIQLNDKELNEESNFPAIVKFLSERVLSRENDRVRDQVLAEVRSAAEHLTLAVEIRAVGDQRPR